MIITIFGATGKVGKQIVKTFLNEGHTVRAYGRNVFTAAFRENKSLELLPGTLFDEEAVYNAILGSDAVLSVIGGAMDGTDKSRSLGMKNIVQQMQRAGVDRIISVGGLGILDDLTKVNGELMMDSDNFPLHFYNVSKEHFEAYKHLAASNLKWTLIGAPEILYEGPTGIYTTAANHPPETNHYHITSGDIALFMVNELNNNEFVRERVGISN
ncbi:MAG: NAD(P)H-binding protein [Ferruginibacter sp.]